jgi:hypothetical protein
MFISLFFVASIKLTAKYTLLIFAHITAFKHIKHGSQLQYISHPDKSFELTAKQAFLIEFISACAVVSGTDLCLLNSFDIILLFLTITAPQGRGSSYF